MAKRTILGNIKNVAPPVNPPQKGGKILQLANQLAGKAGNAGKDASGKENAVEVLMKERKSPYQKQGGAMKRSKKQCEKIPVEPMEEDVVQENVKITVTDEALPDIDKKGEDAWCGDYEDDIDTYLRSRQLVHPVCKTYLKGSRVTKKMRSLLVDWMVEVHQQMDLAQETLFLSVRLLDRYLQEEVMRTSMDDMQLVGVTALLLAYKAEEIDLPSIEDFVYFTDDAITEDEVRAMEVRMLETFDFDIYTPTSLTFLYHSGPRDEDVRELCLAKYILELSLTDLGLSALPPSLAAAGALLLSLKLLETELGSPWSLAEDGEVLASVTRRMAEMLRDSPGHTLQAVRSKYSSRKYKQVATSSSLAPELLSRVSSQLNSSQIINNKKCIS